MKPHLLRGARPIKLKEVATAFKSFNSKRGASPEEFVSAFRRWMLDSKTKTIEGLEDFMHGHYVHGTSQAFDHFFMRHNSRNPRVFAGDFQYHQVIGRTRPLKVIRAAKDLAENDMLVMSVPFSDLGRVHPQFSEIMNAANHLKIPVLLDLAYWGISRNVHINLYDLPCVEVVTCSLSKPFFPLETARVGVRFTRQYLNDGICMFNEVGMFNRQGAYKGIKMMDLFSCDYNWTTCADEYESTIFDLGLEPTDTVIFGTSGEDKYAAYARGYPGNYRICISDYLKSTNEDFYA